MNKQLPSNIKQLTYDIEKASKDEKYHESMAKESKEEWLTLYRERQRVCNHSYADGTSAWKHNYIYSNCEICGYNDL